ncbi:MAG: hypothetical protein JXL80_06245 [Planctomycetes bacterium]|nr:hypothetical protein [Planctomycetota bacterium]
MDTETLRAAAAEAGADLFGVANVERFDELPVEKHPRTIFPEARSVIVLGRRVPRGALRGVEEGTNFSNYILYGVDWLDNRFTSLTTIQVAEFLEDNGWEAVPLPNLPPQTPPMGVAVRPGAPQPNVLLDHDDAAVRAGVGEIGYADCLLTPQFGTRQRIQIILTDAELEPTPLLEETLSPSAAECRKLCPLDAFVGEQTRTICGKSMTVAEIDYAKCKVCKNGATPNRLHAAGKPDRIAATCLRGLLDLMERQGKVTIGFATPLRKREPWVIKPDVDPYKL